MTPRIITRIASGTTTAQDAERILALYNAAQNMQADASDDGAVVIPADDVQNLCAALAALED